MNDNERKCFFLRFWWLFEDFVGFFLSNHGEICSSNNCVLLVGRVVLLQHSLQWANVPPLFAITVESLWIQLQEPELSYIYIDIEKYFRYMSWNGIKWPKIFGPKIWRVRDSYIQYGSNILVPNWYLNCLTRTTSMVSSFGLPLEFWWRW